MVQLKTVVEFCRRLRSNERGNVLAMGAAAMPLLIGSAALGLDTIQLSLAKRQLQRAADSAALAGAYALTQEQSADFAVARDLKLNDVGMLSGAPIVENAPTSGSFAGDSDAVRVILKAQPATPFMAFFRGDPTTLTATATAASVFRGEYCMVALETAAVTGVTFEGNSTVNLHCGVISNSKAAQAVWASGSARVQATPVAAVGGVPASGAFVEPTVLRPYAVAQDDPFAGLTRTPSPPQGMPCKAGIEVLPNRQETLEPGCYKGIDIKGTLTLAPGTYYIDGSGGSQSNLALGSQAVLKGSEVTIVLTSSTPTNPGSFADISMHATANLQVTSPNSGPFKGILFYQDPRAPDGTSKINGTASSLMEGAFYFPSRQVTFNGNSAMQTKCVQIVARRLVFSGNNKVENDCPALGGAKAFRGTLVALVE